MKDRLSTVIVSVLGVLGAGLLIAALWFFWPFRSSFSSGDRVLVAKFPYETRLSKPRRQDVVVFKFPEEPVKKGVPTNYIKRLLGLAGETIAIFFGQLFQTTDLTFPEDQDPSKVNPVDLWKEQYCHKNDDKAIALFREGKFQLIRKDPETILALRRLVFDNDHQAKDLEKVLPARWAPEGQAAWAPVAEKGFQIAEGKGPEVSWLRYRHILRPDDWPLPASKARPHRPQLITDFSGYNSYELEGHRRQPQPNWVGSLLLEFELKVEKAQGELWVELAKGVDRFQARWDLKAGKCTLVRLQDDNGKVKQTELGSTNTRVSQPGTYRIRLANFDEQLTLWVDRELPFPEKGVKYERSWYFDKDQHRFVNVGPTANDLKPASIASKGAVVQVHHLKLWRDTYYTSKTDNANIGPDAHLPQPAIEFEPERDLDKRVSAVAEHWETFWGDPSQWAPLRALEPRTMFVQPKHYLCLGDNSPESSDGRSWGTVPERLLLGRALVVYFPFSRMGPIH